MNVTEMNATPTPQWIKDAAKEIQAFIHCDDMNRVLISGIIAKNYRMGKEQKQSATIEGWVARYESGEIAVFQEKPYRLDNGNWIYDGGFLNFYTFPSEFFPDLKWENEPKKVKMTIEEI